jgi:hypothetical protein
MSLVAASGINARSLVTSHAVDARLSYAEPESGYPLSIRNGKGIAKWELASAFS